MLLPVRQRQHSDCERAGSAKGGFTLVEVLVASTIGALVAMVAVGTLRAVIASNEIIENTSSAAAEVRFAANMISKDLVHLYRDRNKENTKFVGLVVQSGQVDLSYLVFYTVSGVKARAGQPEGDIYEVEYYLMKEEDRSVLMRRFWPNPNKEYEPGGILTVIAEGIEVFEVRYFDGEEWSDEWPEEMQTLPQLIEVNIIAQPRARETPITESFIVNFARFAGAGTGASEGSSGGEGTTEGSSESGGSGNVTGSNQGSSSGGGSGGGNSGGGTR